MKFLLKFLLCPTYWLFKTPNNPTDQQTPSPFSIFDFAKNTQNKGHKNTVEAAATSRVSSVQKHSY